MKNLFSKIIALKGVFFIFLTIIILGLNLTPLISHIKHSPPGRTFALIHNNTQDFFFYQSLLNQGTNGDWLTSDPYTTESHQSSIIFAYFIWLGKIAKLLNLSYPVLYHLLRVTLSFLFLSSIFYLLSSISIPYPRLAFFFFVFASPFMHTINDFGKITSVPFMHWWTGMDPIRRAAYLPHHMFGGLLLVLSVILIIRYFRKSKTKYLITLIFFSLLLAFVHTPSLLILLLILPSTLISYLVITLTFNKSTKSQAPNPKQYQNSNIQNPKRFRIWNFGHLNLFGTWDLKLGISQTIGLFAYWLIGLFFLIFMVSQTNRGFPWSQYIQWERKLQFPLDKELIGALGILLPFSIVGIAKGLLSRRFDQILIICWLIVPLLLIPFAPKLGLSNIRLIQGVPYLPLAILAVLGIDPITGFLTAAIAKISKIIPIKSGQKSPKNAYLASKITGSPARSASTGQAKTQLKIKNLLNTLFLNTGGTSEGLPNVASLKGERATMSLMTDKSLTASDLKRSLGYASDRTRKLKSLTQIIVIAIFIIFTYPTLSWSLKDQIREYWPIFGNVYLDNRLNNAFAFINQNYPPKTITLSTFYTGNYLPAFTNTVSFIGHSGYTYNIDEKQTQVRKFFENKMKDREAKEFLMNNKIVLVFQGPEEKPIYKDYLYPNILKPVYNREEVTLYTPNF